MKKDTFIKEINYIKDNDIKESLETMIELLPDYFFSVAASSTGKYHPEFSLGEGGLVRHTKVATRIAIELFNDSVLTNFTDREKDLIIFSIVLHDGLKSGFEKSEYTKFEHPLLICEFIKDNAKNLKLSKNDIEFVVKCISSHMGPWTKDYKGNEILPSPVSKYERFVHMCDYLSSRRFLSVKFKNNDIDDEI